MPIGICVTKAKNPVEWPAAEMVKVGKDGKIPGISDNDDVKAKVWTLWSTNGLTKTAVKNEAEQHHFIPPKLDKTLEWKLMIL